MAVSAAPPLAPQLQAVKDKFLSSVSEQVVSGIAKTSDNFKKSYTPNPLKLGDVAPDFTLRNATGAEVSLSALLQKHSAVVLTWYRGGWCPYCNLALRAFTQLNEQIEAMGAKLVALSPETPDESLSTSEKNELDFEVLSDDGLLVADKFGVMFTVPDDIKTLYKSFGVDLDSRNGNGGTRLARLPLPATFVLDKSGVVKYVFADVDYTARAEPAHVMDVLNTLAH
eukprot:TRINITY_DN1551_c0_g1_i1.p6 TRINITY_DN1551_c0_g1~~TRINITY_DN1551_c0_g1_i1.p6  ORF type:complete len:226 (-),score=62.97 TRINITY_DN1551_c0_g1_i1:2430-3107(-)